MKRAIRWHDYITFSVLFFGLTTLAQTNGLIFPLMVQDFVGEAQKGSYLGTLRLWTLMVALLAQSVAGMLSDRSTLKWGRRRPFILAGATVTALLVAAVGFIAGLEGMSGYWLLFVVGILMQISSNAAQGPEQAIIPDLVPQEQRGRFSGVKAILELPLPLILVSFTIGKMVSAGSWWTALGIAIAVLLLTALLTMLVPEKPFKEKLPPLDWSPFLRLASMTAVFTVIILGMGLAVKLLGNLLEGVDNVAALVTAMGLLGLLGMAVAVGLGVWLSVRLGIGAEAGKNPSFSWWVINRLAFLVGANNLSTFAVYYLQARLGLEREAAAGPASMLIMFVGVCILLSALPSGWLADRVGLKRVVGASGLIAFLGTLFALLSPNLTVIYIGGSIIGIATGLFFASNWALGTVLVPKEQAGRYLGISNLAGAGAGAVGAYIGGPIADFFTAQVPQVAGIGYILLFSVYGLMFLLSIAALARVKQI